MILMRIFIITGILLVEVWKVNCLLTGIGGPSTSSTTDVKDYSSVPSQATTTISIKPYSRNGNCVECPLKHHMQAYLYQGEMEREENSSVPSSPSSKVDIEKPTQTLASRISSPPIPTKPKIIVLGATGRIGRKIVKRLMASNVDMTVVAFVRSYDKACEELYDDGLLLERENDIKSRKCGPKLKLVVGNLISPEEVFGYAKEDLKGSGEEASYYAKASSAARFYGDNISEYLKRDDQDEAESKENSSLNEALIEALQDCTAIISAVGTVRATLPFADYFWKPWRLFQSPHRWCKDADHPYYVNYHVTKKILAFAEAEQVRRNTELQAWFHEQEELHKEARLRGYYPYNTNARHVDTNKNENSQISQEAIVSTNTRDKIKIIRISDLCVVNPAWSLISVLTNIFRSNVFESQDMAEILLEQNKVVDTIILRPGDLMDEERNTTTTSIQIDTNGKASRDWHPSYVGRDDVAALAVAAALTNVVFDSNATKGKRKKNRARTNTMTNKSIEIMKQQLTVKHFTIALRWAGAHLSQGNKRDGFSNAQECIDHVMKVEAKKAERINALNIARNADPLERFLGPLRILITRRRLKQYRLFILLPMLMTYPMLASMLWSLVIRLPMMKSLSPILNVLRSKILLPGAILLNVVKPNGSS